MEVFINLHLCGLSGLCLMHFFNNGAAKTCRTTVKLAHNQSPKSWTRVQTHQTRVQKPWACWFKWLQRDASRFCKVKGEWAILGWRPYSCETYMRWHKLCEKQRRSTCIMCTDKVNQWTARCFTMYLVRLALTTGAGKKSRWLFSLFCFVFKEYAGLFYIYEYFTNILSACQKQAFIIIIFNQNGQKGLENKWHSQNCKTT